MSGKSRQMDSPLEDGGLNGGPSRNKGKASTQGSHEDRKDSSTQQRLHSQGDGEESLGKQPRRQGNGVIGPPTRSYHREYQRPPQSSHHDGASSSTSRQRQGQGRLRGNARGKQPQRPGNRDMGPPPRPHQHQPQSQGARQSGRSKRIQENGASCQRQQAQGTHYQPQPKVENQSDSEAQAQGSSQAKKEQVYEKWRQIRYLWQEPGCSPPEPSQQVLEAQRQWLTEQVERRLSWIDYKGQLMREVRDRNPKAPPPWESWEIPLATQWCQEVVQLRDRLDQVEVKMAAAIQRHQQALAQRDHHQASHPRSFDPRPPPPPAGFFSAGDSFFPPPSRSRQIRDSNRLAALGNWDSYLRWKTMHVQRKGKNCICDQCTLADTDLSPEDRCPCMRCAGLDRNGMPCFRGWGRILWLYERYFSRGCMLEVGQSDIMSWYCQFPPDSFHTGLDNV